LVTDPGIQRDEVISQHASTTKPTVLITPSDGRSVRSKDDWAKTYILDSAFGCFVKKNRTYSLIGLDRQSESDG
jgi:hypothetical protein